MQLPVRAGDALRAPLLAPSAAWTVRPGRHPPGCARRVRRISSFKASLARLILGNCLLRHRRGAPPWLPLRIDTRSLSRARALRMQSRRCGVHTPLERNDTLRNHTLDRSHFLATLAPKMGFSSKSEPGGPCSERFSRKSMDFRENRSEHGPPGSDFDENPIFGDAAMQGIRFWGSRRHLAAQGSDRPDSIGTATEGVVNSGVQRGRQKSNFLNPAPGSAQRFLILGPRIRNFQGLAREKP